MAIRDVMKFRDEFEYPYPNKRQVAMRIRLATSPAERKVWRDMLKSSCYHKVRDRAGRKVEKKAEDATSAS